MRFDVRGKKITVMGLGVLGRGIGDVKFLAREGAKLIVTDKKDKKALASGLKEIKGLPVQLVLGEHRLKDFEGRDYILKAAGVPYDSEYIAHAQKRGIPIKMDDSWFARYCPAPIVGITGTRGKTTTTTLINEVLQQSRHRVILSGNLPGKATLPLVRSVQENDIVVLELSSWQLQGWRDERLSPHVAVFTNFYRDHQDYYRDSMAHYLKDKRAILDNQTAADIAVLNHDHPVVRTLGKTAKGTVVWFSARDIPKSWKLKLRGAHNLANVAAAVAVGKIFGIPMARIRAVVEKFPGVPGRLEYLATKKGISYYNDTTGTSVEAVMAALNSFSNPVVLLCGGHDKKLDYRPLMPLLKKKTKSIVLFTGKASDQIYALLKKNAYRGDIFWASSMHEAVAHARMSAVRGDTILLSPGAASFGMFKNEYDRGDQFIRAARS